MAKTKTFISFVYDNDGLLMQAGALTLGRSSTNGLLTADTLGPVRTAYSYTSLGMLAATTILPVIGVPVRATALDGMDSLLSIVQMPRGVPVATVAIDNAQNAGLLAAQILATSDSGLADRLRAHREEIRGMAEAADAGLEARLEELGGDGR